MSYGLLAEFADADALLAAASAARAAGFRRLEAYSPFPVEGLGEALGFRRSAVALATLIGGVIGGVTGFVMQYYSAVIAYPINSGGRPLNSWPAFIPVTFELAVLGAAFAAFFGMLLMNGLPRLWHPLQQVHEFDLASRNRFFLCILGSDPRFDQAAPFLDSLAPLCIAAVPE
jgi:hypothetical protein